MSLSYLQVRNPKDDETPIEAAMQIFSSVVPGAKKLRDVLFANPSYTSFEIYLMAQTIFFYITTPTAKETYLRSLISSSYPNAKIINTTDPLDIVFKSSAISTGELILTRDFYLPIKTYQEFASIDPLLSVLGFMARTDEKVKAGIQILPAPATFPWQKSALAAATPPKVAEGETAPPGPNKSQISKKATYLGSKVLIRVFASADDKATADAYLSNLSGTFGSFSQGEGNQFGFKSSDKPKFIERIKERTSGAFENRQNILNAAELATLWHPPGAMLKGIRNISWGKTLSGEPPENLPIPEGMTEGEKQDTNFFATTEYKNKQQIFGIKSADRRKHMYIIGKTGTGKSTLIANMAIDDIRRGRGIGIIDPHGDLSEIILEYIPKDRMKDVVYLEPFDLSRPFRLNILEIDNKEQKHLVASGIISIFYKLYGDSWGPRLEYIFRNVILTLLEIPGATLVDTLRILSDNKYRKQVLTMITDPVILSFWEKEFDAMQDRVRVEAVSPIQNKVGQFVQSPMIRNIIGHPESSISLPEIMDEGKILIVNLSQGKLGEDNAALLGAMFITQLQLAAMRRSFIKEEDRRDFFMYVDEFQNFATDSFIKILSEARKYRLALTLANQYIDQLEEPISNAIFGNVGTMISFVLGASDSEKISKEFGALYSSSDLVGLGKFEITLKLSVDGMTTSPFAAKTLPLPSLKNDNVAEIIAASKLTYGRDPLEKAKELFPGADTPAPSQSGQNQQSTSNNQQRSYQSPKPQEPRRTGATFGGYTKIPTQTTKQDTRHKVQGTKK